MGKIVEIDFIMERSYDFKKKVKGMVEKRQNEGYDVELIAPSVDPTESNGWPQYGMLVVSREKEMEQQEK